MGVIQKITDKLFPAQPVTQGMLDDCDFDLIHTLRRIGIEYGEMQQHTENDLYLSRPIGDYNLQLGLEWKEEGTGVIQGSLYHKQRSIIFFEGDVLKRSGFFKDYNLVIGANLTRLVYRDDDQDNPRLCFSVLENVLKNVRNSEGSVPIEQIDQIITDILSENPLPHSELQA